jgi:hypothetical protein
LSLSLSSVSKEKANVEFHTRFITDKEREGRQRACKWHVVASEAEGFGYTMAEAAACGVPALRTDLPVFGWTWGLDALGCLPMEIAGPIVVNGQEQRELKRQIDTKQIERVVTELIEIASSRVVNIQAQYSDRRKWALHGFLESWRSLLNRKTHAPAIPMGLPNPITSKIGIITVTRNRSKWWNNMCANVAGQTWPHELLEWIIVDDSDTPLPIEKMRATFPVAIRHVVLTEPTSIGEKRNAAVIAASADIDLFVCMDDDDHYPKNSVLYRVIWLLSDKEKSKSAAYTSTLPMYDIRNYVSAVNVPPLNLSPAERVSEATLAFTRAFWTARPFPTISMAEGEGFLQGRDKETVEIPPYGVIVSFIHAGNSSSRRVPEKQEPNGCHYGFSDEYFSHIHSIAE